MSQKEVIQSLHPEGFTLSQETLASSILKVEGIKFGAFKLKLHETNPDAPLSPYYIDLGVLPINIPELRMAAVEYARLAEGLEYDCVMGIPERATPLATAVALETGKPQIVLRKQEKMGHGMSGKFATPIKNGETVLLIDDLVTQADTKIEAIETLKASGLKVKDIIVLIDREQGGAKQLKELGYNLHASFGFSKLLEYYHRTGLMDQVKYQEARAYLAANQ